MNARPPMPPRHVDIFTYGGERCGISIYGAQLGAALRACGATTQLMTYGAAHARRSPRLPLSGMVLNFEVGQSLRRPLATLAMLSTLLRRHIMRRATTTIVHVVYDDAELRRRLGHVGGRVFSSYQRLALRLVAATSRVVALNETMRESLCVLGVEANVIPIGTYTHASRPSRRDAIRASWNANAADVVVGLVGHPLPFKHYAAFAKRYFAAPASGRARLRLVYVGGEPERARAEWAAIAAAFTPELGTTAFITGPLDEETFSATIAALDVCALPYGEIAQESGVLATVAAAGVPCVVSTAALFVAIVAAGAAQRLAWDTLSSEALVATLLALNLPDMRRCMVAYAQAHSIEHSARQLLALLAAGRAA